MSDSEIVTYLKVEIEPLKDNIYGERYRAAAYLIDGTYLPCVVFQSKRRLVDLALRRFAETKSDRGVVESFIAGGSSIDSSDVLRVEPSPFAWPLATFDIPDGYSFRDIREFVLEWLRLAKARKRFPLDLAN